jgi:hypothetical protein
MTEFELRSDESDEEKLARLEREYEEKHRQQETVVADVSAASRTSARALFALGIIAGIAGSSILWFERRVDAFLQSIQPENYPVTKFSDVAPNDATRLIVTIDEIIEAYEAALLIPAAPGAEPTAADDARQLMSCALSARSALVTPEGAQTLVAPYAGCGDLLEGVSEYKQYTAKDVAAASITALVSLDRGTLSDVLVATWDSKRLMPTHQDLASVMVLATFIDRRDAAGTDLGCNGDAKCRFQSTLFLSWNLVNNSDDLSINPLAQPLGDGAAPYRYAASVTDFENAGAYNFPAEVYLISTSEGDTIVQPAPIVEFDYAAAQPKPFILGADDVWNANVNEGELIVTGMRPVGWWPCNPSVVYSFFPKQGIWVEKFRTLPKACENANYETLDGVDPEANFDDVVTTVARPEAIEKAIALFE